MIHRWFLMLLICWSAGAAGQTDSASTPVTRFQLKGYVKHLHQSFFSNQLSGVQSAQLLHNRINMQVDVGKKVMLRADLRNRIFYGELIRQHPNYAAALENPNDFFDLTAVWYNKSGWVLHTVVDRAYLRYTAGKWDVSAGRQRINWGVTTVWTPNDIFNTYNFFDFDYEERPGSDALRIQYSPSGFSAVELAFKPGRHRFDHIAAMLYRFNQRAYDIQLLGGLLQTDAVAGIGWAGRLYDAGFKGEATWLEPLVAADSSRHSRGFLSTISLDYAFKKGWYGSASFLYNHSGINQFNSIEGFYTTRLTLRHLMPFTYSWCAMVNKSISPVWNSTLTCIYSPASNAWITVPTLSYSAADNLDFLLTGQLFFATQNRHYTSLGNSIFFRTKWSF